MRLTHPDGSVVHLAYCSNVHPAEDVPGVIGQLRTYAAPIRQRLGWERLGIGLWLAAGAARELDADDGARDALRTALDDAGCEVVTLNGFPYEGFHDEVVKQAVYHPNWTTDARREHTLRLARVLADLLPDDVEAGSISTLPIGWRTDIDGGGMATASAALAGLAADLDALEHATGKRIAVALEPEPGCIVETAAGLAVHVGHVLADHPRQLGACLDLAHMAVQFEAAGDAMTSLDAAGVPVHKAQVSAAMKVPRPDTSTYRAALRPFTTSPFLHQTRTIDHLWQVVGVDDLDQALGGVDGREGLPDAQEWRVHVHLPLHQGGPDSTTEELLDALDVLVGGPTCRTRHLEVETYTWSVLPPGHRPDDADDPVEGLVSGIAAELAWTLDRLTDRGLTPLSAVAG